MSRQATQPAPPLPPNASAADTAVARSQHLDASLEKAHRLAMSQHHGGVSLEHLLFALSEDPEALIVLGASTVNIDRLRADITTHLGQMPNNAPAGKAILPTMDLLKVLKLAATAAQQSARRQIDGAIVLAAIIGDASTPSAGLLRAHGLTFQEVIRVLQKSAAPNPSAAPPPEPGAPTRPVMPPVAAQSGAAVEPPAPVPPQVRPSNAPDAAPAGQSATATPQPAPRSSTDDLLASVRARLQETAPPPVSRRPDKLATVVEPAVNQKPGAAAAVTGAEPRLPTADRADPPTVAIEQTKVDAATSAPTAAAAAATATATAKELSAGQASAAQVPPANPAGGPRSPQDLLPKGQQKGSVAAQPASAPLPRPTEPPAVNSGTSQLQPPLPLVPAAGQRSGPPPLPLPTMSGGAPAATPPRLPPAPTPGTTATAAPAAREPLRAPPIPPPTVDMRSLVTTLPRHLRQGQTDIVEIVVSRRSLEIPPAQGHRWPPLRVATMRLKASQDDAHVELASPETLWISPPRVHQGADDATWRWRVTPRNKGRIRLSLAGATRIVGSEGISGEIPLGEESVEVDVARRGSRRGLVGLLLFGNLLALGVLAMVMSGRAGELSAQAWKGLRGLIGM